jgi:hypothetical protein
VTTWDERGRPDEDGVYWHHAPPAEFRPTVPDPVVGLEISDGGDETGRHAVEERLDLR